MVTGGETGGLEAAAGTGRRAAGQAVRTTREAVAAAAVIRITIRTGMTMAAAAGAAGGRPAATIAQTRFWREMTMTSMAAVVRVASGAGVHVMHRALALLLLPLLQILL